jgi:hypothetical protein
LQYWQRLDLASGDSAQVQVSTDNTNWTSVASETTVRNLAWTARTVNLSAYAGQPLWLRFVLSTDEDPTTVADGWCLDDITIWAEPLPVNPRIGLTSLESDDPWLWLTEGSWLSTTTALYSGSLAWTSSPQPETAVGLTLNTDVSLASLAQPELRFWQLLDLAAGADNAQVQLSTDGGQTWFSLATYSAADNSSTWTEKAISLASYAGQTVRVRFLLTTDNDGLAGTGWTVDAISLQSAGAPVATDTPTPMLSATPTPTLDASGWTTYEDTDPLMFYGNGTWQTFDVAGAVGGNLTGSADPGATFTANFEGTGIRIIYSQGPEGDLFSAQVDDGLPQTGNSAGTNYSYGSVLALEGLSEGQHSLTVTNGDGAIWIEAVQVQGTLINEPVSTPTPTPTQTPTIDPSWITYEDTDPLLVYGNGTWQSYNVAGAVGGTLTASADAGATLTAYFEGTGIRVIYSKGPEGGPFSGQVDSDEAHTADGYDEGYSYGYILAVEGLAEGQHTLTITNGDGAIWTEAVAVQGELTTAPEFEETELELLHSDDFDDNHLAHWVTGSIPAGLFLVPSETGQALWIFGYASPVSYEKLDLFDQVINLRFRIATGKATFSFRHSGAGEYLISTDIGGDVTVTRNDAFLATGMVAPTIPGEWRTLRIAILADRITVSLDGTEIVNVVDPAPLPPGALSFLSESNHDAAFLIDDFELWVPASDIPQTPLGTPVPSVTPEESTAGYSILSTTSSNEAVSGKFVYLCGNEGYAITQLCVAQADGSGSSMITEYSSGDFTYGYLSPAWSPDGTKIAAIKSTRWDEPAYPYPNPRVHTDIVVMNEDGSNQELIDPFSGLIFSIFSLDWSPDGSWFAIEAPVPEQVGMALYYVDTNCRGSCAAYSIPTGWSEEVWDASPTWSPDSEALAFMSNRGGNWHAYTVRLDGTELQQVSTAPLTPSQIIGPPYRSAWSPDSTKLALNHTILLSSGYNHTYIEVVPIPTQMAPDSLMLASIPPAYEITFPPQEYIGDSVVDWSPDSTRITFTRSSGVNLTSYIAMADGYETGLTEIGSTGELMRWYRTPCTVISAPETDLRTQEVRDMRAVVDPDGQGLIVHAGPAINAMRLGTIPWDMAITPNAQFEVKNGDDKVIQTWYRLDDLANVIGYTPYPRENSPTINVGWIMGGIANPAGTPDEFIYVQDKAMCVAKPAEELTFYYDREMAATVAIEHSYDTAQNHSLLQNQGRVTQRIDSDVPYAYFRYTPFDPTTNVTGSATFVSESLWMGGLPMIVGNTSCDSGENSLEHGWRYCFTRPNATPPSGVATNPFDTHGDLIGFWVDRDNADLDNTVLDENSKGRQIFIDESVQTGTGLAVSALYIRGQDSSKTDLYNFIKLGDGDVFEPGPLSQRVSDLLSTDSNIDPDTGTTNEVKMGDYLFISTAPEHGLVIIGWQAAMDCSQAIFADGVNRVNGYRRWSITDFGMSYTDAQSRGIPYPVPWVADFTSPPNGNDQTDATQSPVPRPFYCTMYWEPDLNPDVIRGTDRFYAHDWYFYTMPDTVTASASTAPDQLYVDSQWQWSNE